MASLCKEKGDRYRIHWRFRVRVGPRAGETLAGSMQLGRCTRAVAKAHLRELETWEEAVKTGRHVPGQSWQDVYARWLRDRELTYTPQSMDRAKRVVSLYLRWRKAKKLRSDTVEQIGGRADLVKWRDHRLDHEAGRKTVANDLATLLALFEWCVREKYLQENPISRIARPRFVSKKEGTPLTRTQAGQWLCSIKPRTAPGTCGPWTMRDVRRKRQIAVFLLNTGIRNGEFCALNIEDIRVDEHEQLLHVMGKGLKQRWVPLNLAALAAVRCHLRSRGNPRRGPLFATQAGERYNVRQLASELVKTARHLDPPIQVNPHNLRHSFATWLTRSLPDVSLAQKILGHVDSDTTLRYYVHSCDYELAGATANLRARANGSRRERRTPSDGVRFIPFPKKSVS